MNSTLFTLITTILFTLGSSMVSANQEISVDNQKSYDMEICIKGGWHDLTGGGEYIVEASVEGKLIEGKVERKEIQLYQFGRMWPQDVGGWNNRSVSLTQYEETCFESEFKVSKDMIKDSKLSIVVIEADGVSLKRSKYDDYIFINEYAFTNFESKIISGTAQIKVKLAELD